MPVDSPFHSLTESEKSCLRLVHQGLTSKQIAARRNVRPDRIDKILQAARIKLAGLPRREAARRLHEYETAKADGSPADHQEEISTSEPEPLGAPALGLVDQRERALTSSSDGSSDGRSPAPIVGLADVVNWPVVRQLFNSRSLRNGLDILFSVAAISVVAAGAACMAVVLLSLFIVIDGAVIGS